MPFQYLFIVARWTLSKTSETLFQYLKGLPVAHKCCCGCIFISHNTTTTIYY